MIPNESYRADGHTKRPSSVILDNMSNPISSSTKNSRKRKKIFVKRFLKLQDGSKVEIPKEEFENMVFTPIEKEPKICFLKNSANN